MNIKQWVKNHKKEFTNKFIRESGASPNKDEPSCIFMAGLPGAGKTEYTKTLIAESNIKVVRIDMDEIASMIDSYVPEKADMFRLGAVSLQNDIYEKCHKGYYPFIMDGTLSNEKTVKSIKTVLNKGYSVKVIYIKQDPQIAWRNTKEREKIEHRSIDKDGFIKSYNNTINNLHFVKEYNGIKMDIIIKDGSNSTITRIMDAGVSDLDKYVKNEYSIKQLEGLLRNE
jgi:predicted ABC-type ATPase